MPAQAARVIELAFDPKVETADDAMAERILDAALALVAASGLQHLTMDDVARRAGVGRMTVYRRFGSKAALVDALSVREARRCLAALSRAAQPGRPIDERLADVFVETLELIREHPLLARLARVEPEALLRELTRNDSAVFRLVRQFLIGLVRHGQAEHELVAGDPALLAEVAVRLGASFVLIPDSLLPLADRHATRKAVRALLAPMLAY